MQGLLLPICSIIFSILLCICFFIKKRLPLLENNMYSIMIIAVLIDSILVTIIQYQHQVLQYMRIGNRNKGQYLNIDLFLL